MEVTLVEILENDVDLCIGAGDMIVKTHPHSMHLSYYILFEA